MDNIALIADVHGNIPALEAVIADIKARGIDRVFSLGDIIGGPDGEEAFNICYDLCEKMIMGNWEDFLINSSNYPNKPKSKRYKEQLSPETLEKIAKEELALKFFISGRRMHLIHGRPLVSEPMWMESPAEEMEVMFSLVEDEYTADIVGYADLHRQYIYDYQDEPKTIFNIGSVGQSFGTQNACYAILHGEMDSSTSAPFSVEFVSVPYDTEESKRRAEAQKHWFDANGYNKILKTSSWHNIE